MSERNLGQKTKFVKISRGYHSDIFTLLYSICNIFEKVLSCFGQSIHSKSTPIHLICSHAVRFGPTSGFVFHFLAIHRLLFPLQIYGILTFILVSVSHNSETNQRHFQFLFGVRSPTKAKKVSRHSRGSLRAASFRANWL